MGKEKGYRYTRKQRDELLSRYRRSGISVNRFCEQMDISYSTLTRWLRQIEGTESEVKLVEIAAEPVFAKNLEMTVRLSNGISCEVGGQLGVADALNWIRELNRC